MKIREHCPPIKTTRNLGVEIEALVKGLAAMTTA